MLGVTTIGRGRGRMAPGREGGRRRRGEEEVACVLSAHRAATFAACVKKATARIEPQRASPASAILPYTHRKYALALAYRRANNAKKQPLRRKHDYSDDETPTSAERAACCAHHHRSMKAGNRFNGGRQTAMPAQQSTCTPFHAAKGGAGRNACGMASSLSPHDL